MEEIKDERRHEPVQSQDDASLKGTFASVMLLGVFIACTWAAVFLLFMARQ